MVDNIAENNCNNLNGDNNNTKSYQCIGEDKTMNHVFVDKYYKHKADGVREKKFFLFFFKD